MAVRRTALACFCHTLATHIDRAAHPIVSRDEPLLAHGVLGPPAVMMDIQALLVCGRCQRPFERHEQVVMAVPFRERGSRVLMGDESLFHEACGPIPRGMREVGRGRYDEVIDGIRSGPHSEGVAPEDG